MWKKVVKQKPRMLITRLRKRLVIITANAPPTASPKMNRKTVGTIQLGERTQPRAPTMKISAKDWTLRLRPKRVETLSSRTPPIAAPNIRTEVMKLVVQSVNPKTGFMESRTPLMTPVS